MSVRRPASLLLFASACMLLGGALLTLLAALLLPYEGLQDLGRIVLAMLLAALSVPFFAGTLCAARGIGLPRWMLATSWAGVIIGTVPAIAILSVRL